MKPFQQLQFWLKMQNVKSYSIVIKLLGCYLCIHRYWR